MRTQLGAAIGGANERERRFSAGKPNALVIDVGANTTSVTPIYDGFVLKKGESTMRLEIQILIDRCRRAKVVPSRQLHLQPAASAVRPNNAFCPASASLHGEI